MNRLFPHKQLYRLTYWSKHTDIPREDIDDLSLKDVKVSPDKHNLDDPYISQYQAYHFIITTRECG